MNKKEGFFWGDFDLLVDHGDGQWYQDSPIKSIVIKTAAKAKRRAGNFRSKKIQAR